ncbi:MAG: hypothetical protein JKX85_14555 [Phycisphaeraceae bacterium]|nr:hypothetical protein [Phycisphaeraceae bacterium]
MLHIALDQSPSAMGCRLLLIQCLEEIGSNQGIHEQAQAILQVDPYHPYAQVLLERASR